MLHNQIEGFYFLTTLQRTLVQRYFVGWRLLAWQPYHYFVVPYRKLELALDGADSYRGICLSLGELLQRNFEIQSVS